MTGLTKRQREVLSLLGRDPLSEREIFQAGFDRGFWPIQTNVNIQLWALYGRNLACHTGARGHRKWGITPDGQGVRDAS